ncbi:MAG: hypothetical protein ABSG80_05435 [Verrucomicrobiota bacterium]|jgi:hypothetical protein
MKLKLLVLVLALQSAWLLGTVAMQEHALAPGRIILLETARIDPCDLLHDGGVFNRAFATVSRHRPPDLIYYTCFVPVVWRAWPNRPAWPSTRPRNGLKPKEILKRAAPVQETGTSLARDTSG